MNPRNTGTGAVLEQMILPALKRGGYSYRKQVNIGERLGGGRHVVDVVAEAGDGSEFLISLKWQQVSGTAEQKVPFEVICLAHAVRMSGGQYKRAYLVLGGSGWHLRDFYVRRLDNYLPHGDTVTILSLEDFVALANQGKL